MGVGTNRLMNCHPALNDCGTIELGNDCLNRLPSMCSVVNENDFPPIMNQVRSTVATSEMEAMP